ncbi:MAG: hypothetical protein GFH27_549287n226 [Chloroflexi bacterium AL-W]|nr:hypothetical protein [Chloroflexi bacterium AL-N1]NOK66500.1 hypothetical protein [Chloroflexi bacterium AL-N10]NOK71888.1 hypothetical protein [Chloroflexi bacterium AL-N5]NOK81145.1 hypothetical protein [Chloroflexi bacterium AL-W]NOK89418.1 hypothetical protein [Chloroflexi bacterium AL-N15]
MNPIVTKFISDSLQRGDRYAPSDIEQNLSDTYHNLKAALGKIFGLDSLLLINLETHPTSSGRIVTFHEGLFAANISQNRL